MLHATVRVIWILNTFVEILGYGDLSANGSAKQYKTTESCLNPKLCGPPNAVDRNMSTCTQTIMGITSPDQNTWWYVDLGDVRSVYNIRVQFKDYGQEYDIVMRQRGRFAGFSLYVSNTIDVKPSGVLCYKDGPDLPPLDFNTNCVTHGRYVIFYNERLPGTTYPMGYETSNVLTELCEVTVKGCLSSGVYGQNCDKVCLDNCQESRCDIINGTCLGCTPGWVGAHCNKTCPAGYYGLQCESKCVGHCKDSETCNHINGLCDFGCDDGWTGSNCTKECPLETYGPGCAYKCTGNCLGHVACNKSTGKCDTGCDFGYTGELCCEIGAYGKGCSNQCSGHCLASVTCNTTTGHCDSGCASGYLEPFCNKSCEIGTFGKGCNNRCSGHCLDINVPCNSTTGHCDGGCVSGYVEPFCNKTDSKSTAFSDNCNDSSYIAALSVLAIICIVLGSVCLLFMWKYYRLVKKVCSLQYTTIIKTSIQNNNANNCQQYEELRVSENGYHNINLRN